MEKVVGKNFCDDSIHREDLPQEMCQSANVACLQMHQFSHPSVFQFMASFHFQKCWSLYACWSSIPTIKIVARCTSGPLYLSWKCEMQCCLCRRFPTSPQTPKRNKQATQFCKWIYPEVYCRCGYLIAISFISYRPRGESRLVRWACPGPSESRVPGWIGTRANHRRVARRVGRLLLQILL